MNRLKELRLEKHMSQAKLAEVFNISQQAVSHYEKGLRDMDHTLMTSISDFFNVSIDYLLGLSQIRNYEEITTEDKINKLIEESGINTIAAHFEGEEFTEDDLEDIENFINFVLAKKKKKK